MRRIEQIKEDVQRLLAQEGALYTHQLASMFTPPISHHALNMALQQLAAEDVIDLKARVGWYLKKDDEHADQA